MKLSVPDKCGGSHSDSCRYVAVEFKQFSNPDTWEYGCTDVYELALSGLFRSDDLSKRDARVFLHKLLFSKRAEMFIDELSLQQEDNTG